MSDGEAAERRLRALASEPVPPADPTFVDYLDVHLRVLHVKELEATRTRPMRVPAVLGSLAIILLVVAGGLMLTRTSNATVILMAASDTDVVLPGDEATAASAGLHLPDGTRIVVGDSGEAVVNGVVLGPGSEATVVGDQIDIVVTMFDESAPIDGGGSEPLVIEGDAVGDDGRSPATAVPDGNPASTSGPANTDRPAATDRRETDVGAGDGADNDRNNGSGGDEGVTTTTTRGQPSSTLSSATVAATSTIPLGSTTSTTTETSSTTNGRRPEPLELTVTPVGRDRLRLDWTLNREVLPAGWRVRVRRGDRLITVVAIRDGDAHMITIEQSIPAGGAVWIEALDREGTVLLASDPVEIDGS